MSMKSHTLLASAAIVLALGACNSSDGSKSAAPAEGAVAATVNGAPISQTLVDLLVKQRGAQGAPDTPEARKELIDQLAMQTLVAQEASKKGLDKTPEVIAQADMARQSILANAFVQDYLKTNPVSDEALKAEYDKIKLAMGGDEYQARHILVKTEAEAVDIIAKLKKDPKVFAALAKEKSMDPGSKVNGGELGWFDPKSMVPEFGAALAKLEKGKFTETPVKTQFGFHVILLEDTRAKQIPDLAQVTPQLRQQVQQQNLKAMLDTMKSTAKIEVMQAAASAPAKSAEPAKAASKP